VSRASTEVAKNAQDAAESSQTADDAARKGLGLVEQTVQVMGQIKNAVQELRTAILATFLIQSQQLGTGDHSR
jgi:methyl-accepting chemotaxis protein